MKKILYSVLFVLFLTFSSFSQGQIIFDFDYAQFRNDSVTNSIEFYYSFNQNAFKNSNGSIYALMQVLIKDTTTKEIVWGKRYLVTQNVNDTTTGSVIGMFALPLKKGNYEIDIIIKDSINQSVYKSVKENIKVLPLVANSMTISDIELSTNILEDNSRSSSIFYKNGHEIIPLPTSVYNAEVNPVMFFYAELYNLNKVKHEQPFKLHYYVFNGKGKIVYHKVKDIPHKLESRVEVGFIPIYKFANDTYTLTITVIDSASNYGISSSKKFFLLNPKVKQEEITSSNTNALSSEFGQMGEEELDDLFAKSMYIANRTEVDKFKTLKGVDSKREFLFQFWKTRDYDVTTSENEGLKDYLHKVEVSNQRYSSTTKIGWKSDRGRVYLLFGEPSEVERFPNQVDTKPYEIWHYNEIEGGVVFVFADISGFSEYLLLHSTKRGELRDDNWSRRIESF